ncbi:MAG: hypothetical protein HOV81_21690 [Kofleriaceae bacterium]|nr:hypothetical protein [Kofleriaceae bacterium]
MKWAPAIACLVLAACQADSTQTPPTASSGGSTAQGSNTAVISLPKAQVTDEYRTDITSLCDCVHESGADQMPKNERWPVIAMWLGPHITTDAGHEFLVAIQPLQGEAKALALETEARRVGLAKCDLANEWRGE